MAKASAQITLHYVVDVKAAYRYYLLQSSTAAKPSKPTIYPPPSSWDDAEPTYTSGSTNSLYFVDCTVFSDNSYKYSEVSLSSSYEAAKEAFNRAVDAQNIANAAQNALEISLDVIIGTQTAVTGAWTGVAKFSELKDGQQIVYWLPYAGSGNATLNLTLSNGKTTGAKNCYYGGATRLTTHYPAGSTIRLIYRENVSIAGSATKYTGWWSDANYNSDTLDRTRYNRAIKCGGTAIVAGNLIVGSNGAYQHLKTGASFDISYPILYAGSAISANGTGTNNYLTIPFNVTTTQPLSLTTYTPVYIKGKLSGTEFSPISTTPLTQTIPTSVDGYDYILLGQATSSSTEIYLMPEHPIFTYYKGGFKSFEQIAAEAAINSDNLAGSLSEVNSALTESVDGLKNDLGVANENISNLQEEQNNTSAIVSQNKQKIASIETQNGNIIMNFNELTETVTMVNDKLVTEMDDRYKYIKFIDGEIWLGKEVEENEDDFKLVIRRERISFLQNGSEVAYISNRKLYITDADISNSLKIGGFTWETRQNGNMGLVWK